MLGGAIAAVVQWFFTPRVQSTIRMHERREHALLELGRVLTEDVPPVRSRLTSTASVLAATTRSIAAGEVDESNPTVRELVDRDREAIGSAGEDWRALRVRIDWLAHLAGERLRPLHKTFHFAAMRVPTFAAECERLSDDERDTRWAEKDNARVAFVQHVQEKVPRVDVDRSGLSDRVTKWLPRRHHGRKSL